MTFDNHSLGTWVSRNPGIMGARVADGPVDSYRTASRYGEEYLIAEAKAGEWVEFECVDYRSARRFRDAARKRIDSRGRKMETKMLGRFVSVLVSHEP